MAMNINNLTNNNQVKQNIDSKSQVKQQSATSANVADTAKLASRDSVSLTAQAKQFTELQKKASDAPVVNQKKVDELKKAILSGDYKINPEKLAASIADFEFALPKAK